MLEKALEKLDPKGISGQKEKVMAGPVAEALKDFCRQDEEFAQAVAQGGSFKDCMTAVAKCVGQHISDIDAYKKAVRFFFPGADIKVQMSIDLIGDATGTETSPAKKPAGIVLNLEDFLL